MILNDLNSNDIMSEVIKNINNMSLPGFKRIVKTFFLDKYSFTCSISNCYVCGKTYRLVALLMNANRL